MKQKCIVVSYPLGRVGSSVMMGLLKSHGIYVGEEESMVSFAKMNPKGFFELQDQDKLLSSIFLGVYPGKSIPPAISWVKKKAKENKSVFSSYLSKLFHKKDCFAIKSPRCLSLVSFELLKDIYDIKVIFLTRNREEQVFSLGKVNGESREFLANFVDDWYGFSSEIFDLIDFDCLSVDFTDLINIPEIVLKNVFKKFEIDKEVNLSVVEEWVNKNLVNRRKNE